MIIPKIKYCFDPTRREREESFFGGRRTSGKENKAELPIKSVSQDDEEVRPPPERGNKLFSKLKNSFPTSGIVFALFANEK